MVYCVCLTCQRQSSEERRRESNKGGSEDKDSDLPDPYCTRGASSFVDKVGLGDDLAIALDDGDRGLTAIAASANRRRRRGSIGNSLDGAEEGADRKKRGGSRTYIVVVVVWKAGI